MIEEILTLNEKLRLEELRLRKLYFEVKNNAELFLFKRTISDYEIGIEVSFFTNNKNLNRKYKIEKGAPFYLMKHLTSAHLESENFDSNWAEGNEKRKYNFCYTMHHLIYDCHLNLEEILQVEDVWFDLQVIYQFMFSRLEREN